MPSLNKKCHNCRRRRLRCDGSWPTCHKCAATGQDCLGYGRVFIWTQGIDAHGNLKPSPSGRRPSHGARFDSAVPDFEAASTGASTRINNHGPQDFSSRHLSQPHDPAMSDFLKESRLSAAGALTDPVFQDLDRNSRYYLAHCKSAQSPEASANRGVILPKRSARSDTNAVSQLRIVCARTWWYAMRQKATLFANSFP